MDYPRASYPIHSSSCNTVMYEFADRNKISPVKNTYAYRHAYIFTYIYIHKHSRKKHTFTHSFVAVTTLPTTLLQIFCKNILSSLSYHQKYWIFRRIFLEELLSINLGLRSLLQYGLLLCLWPFLQLATILYCMAAPPLWPDFTLLYHRKQTLCLKCTEELLHLFEARDRVT